MKKIGNQDNNKQMKNQDNNIDLLQQMKNQDTTDNRRTSVANKGSKTQLNKTTLNNTAATATEKKPIKILTELKKNNRYSKGKAVVNLFYFTKKEYITYFNEDLVYIYNNISTDSYKEYLSKKIDTYVNSNVMSRDGELLRNKLITALTNNFTSLGSTIRKDIVNKLFNEYTRILYYEKVELILIFLVAESLVRLLVDDFKLELVVENNTLVLPQLDDDEEKLLEKFLEIFINQYNEGETNSFKDKIKYYKEELLKKK